MAESLDPLHLPLRGSRLIEASAGTGKTWTIAALYLRLVLGHGDAASRFDRPLLPSQILVMTFTRAATRELSDRIRSRLVEAARCFRGEQTPTPGDSLLQGLLADHPSGPQREAAAWRLAMAAEAMDDAAISTIDAWCQRMLREHAFDSGSLFDEELHPDEEGLIGEAARDYWRSHLYPLQADALDAARTVWRDVDRLSADVRSLLEHADPAHGSAASLAEVWQRGSAARRDAVLRLKDGWSGRAQEMRDWLTAQLNAKPSPFHRQKLQSRHVAAWFDAIDEWARTPDIEAPALSPTAQQRLTPQGLREVRKGDEAPPIPPLFHAFAQLLDAIAALPQPAHAMRLHAAAQVAAQLREQKRRSGTFGFLDLLERLDAALAGAAGQRLRERITAQYPVALIDEFQDTSPLQYRIFDRLYAVGADDPKLALFLIGDPKQSIYAFRGADIRSYLAARRATAGRHHLLGTNFRSTGPLVAAVNRLFEQAESRHQEGAFRYGSVADAPSANPLPFVAVAARGRDEVFTRAAGPVPALTICHQPQLAAGRELLKRFSAHCAEHIVGLLGDRQAGFRAEGGGFTRLRPADIAVLVRTGREAEAVRRALRHRRVASVYLSEKDSVFASAEAADLLHWLRAVATPLDGGRVRAAFATATIDLPLAELAAWSEDDRAFERRIEQLSELNTVWHRHGVLAMLRLSLHRLDLPARWLAEPGGERRLTNVLHLAELLQAEGAGLDGQAALIRWFAQQLGRSRLGSDEQIVRLESDADLVRVVTIHKAKGLEYPLVYLPFGGSFRLAEGDRSGFTLVAGDDGVRRPDFSRSKTALAAADLERSREELRLLYVALTRAQHAIWLGIGALKAPRTAACVFHRSALGYLFGGGREVDAAGIAGLIDAVYADADSVLLTQPEGDAPVSLLAAVADDAPLHEAPAYAARFERDWSIGSFSSLVRDLPAAPGRYPAVDAARAEELATTPDDDAAVPPASAAPRHRFPRGGRVGNFLHDQLEWLAGERFALAADADLRLRLQRRSERAGWGHLAGDVAQWLGEVIATPLPPLGVALDGVDRLLPEMEFWLPAAGVAARRIDALCRSHLLGGRPRPALPERRLDGMLMGFADLVFEHGGRYWVLDYKSNALGAGDADYHRDALAAAMAEHRYDVQAAVYLLALHRLLRQRLGSGYDPDRQLGGAIYLFMRGMAGPEAGCFVVAPGAAFLDQLDGALAADAVPAA